MDIVLSIHHEHCVKVLSGEKPWELRKSFPRKPVKRVFLYECGKGGRQAIVGVCILAGYAKADPKLDAALIAEKACLTMEQLRKYVGEKKVYAWNISNPRKLASPLQITDFGLSRPPQSWCYGRAK
jgi:Uncharacterized conserved protein